MTNNVTSVSQGNNNYSNSSIIKGIMAVYCAKRADVFSRMIIGKNFSHKLYNLKKSLSPTDKEIINVSSKLVFEQEGLSKAGVRIFNITADNVDKYKKFLKNRFNKLFFFKYLPTHIKDKWVNSKANNYLLGKQAVYTRKNKLIVISKENSILSLFHEAGHAINHNYSHFWKTMQNLRVCRYLALPITIIAVFKNNNANREKSKGFVDKTTTFIKNNAGKLAFLTFVPTLAEEAMASFRGNRIAKKILGADLASMVKKASHYGFYTYLTAAVTGGLSAYLAVKLRNKIDE